MKIFIFEYITGGGFNKNELPNSLAREGSLMLQALLDSLATENHDLILMLDERVKQINPYGAMAVLINFQDDCLKNFINLVATCDAVSLIAPEFDGILETLCSIVENSGKLLLSSPAKAVVVTADKFKTYRRLCQFGIATVPTQMLTTIEPFVLSLSKHDTLRQAQGERLNLFNSQEWLIKPTCGVGCMDSYVLPDLTQLETLNLTQPSIIQPHIHGDKTSLSCVFKNGQAWLLTINLQHFAVIDGQYHLQAISVNYRNDYARYAPLVTELARAFPELWGYVGIDLIETAEQILVLEINPRLTSSFVGIQAATGINVCNSVLQLLSGTPHLTRTCNQPIILQFT